MNSYYFRSKSIVLTPLPNLNPQPNDIFPLKKNTHKNTINFVLNNAKKKTHACCAAGRLI